MSLTPGWPPGPQDILLVVAVAVAAATDLKTGKIYNALTLPLLLSGLLLAFFFPEGSGGGPKSSLLGLVVGFVPLYLVYLRGGMGGGDVKLMAAIGALKGFPFVLDVFLNSVLIGAAMGVGIIVWERRVKEAALFVWTTIARVFHPGVVVHRLETKRVVPFGLAIALAAGLTLVQDFLRYAGR